MNYLFMMVFSAAAELAQKSVSNLPEIEDFEIFWNRLFLVLWFFIFPSIIIFINVVNNHLFKKDVFLIYRSLYKFVPYRYLLHNLIFCFFLLNLIVNTSWFLYVILNFFVAPFHTFAVYIEKDVGKFNKVEFFWKVVFSGYILHLIASFTYIHHNLYKTDSYFSDWWEKKINIISKSNKFLKLEKFCPWIAKLIRKYLLTFDKHKILSEKHISLFF